VKRTTNRPTTTRSERTTIALVTCGFILASGVIHMIMGGIIRPIHFIAAPKPSITEIVLFHLESPKPTPPPTPRPSPKPKPTVTQIVRHPLAQPSAAAHPAAQQHPVAVPQVRETPASSSGSDDGQATPEAGPAQPAAAPSPTDYRYVIVSERFIHRVDPIYPQDAMGGDEEGTVIILLTIGADGVSDVRVWETSGYPALDRAALEAAKESTYSLPEVNGEPVTETYRIIYTFALNS
jgi:protein TonB